ncbi:MAG TPA: cyclopropane-fatty-acyl-phospholipid synthase family protein [Candidatus Binatia bacterium]|jgi:cyclopropane-fatty-acyl-phospholipid synthase
MGTGIGHSVSDLSSTPDRLTVADRAAAALLARALRDAALRIVLWDGTELSEARPGDGLTVRIHSRRALFRLILNPQLNFGECYAEGSLDVEGALPDAVCELFRATGEPRGVAHAIDCTLDQIHRIDPSRSRDNVHHHYDLGNEFYKLWLDSQMVYTCAYFPTTDATLEQAQTAKLDHVCRKLRLGPGERVIEAGCGWGALALHMAEHYGVTVRAFNLSREQVAYARDLAMRKGLAGRVEFIEDDYRAAHGRCDAFVSVGMLEHVGLRSYRDLGHLIRRVLAPDGRGFLHTIGRHRPAPINAWIRRRIFPGAYVPSLQQMMEIFEPNGLVVLDVENLRPHYARTLEHWLARYERSLPEIRRMFDERFVRTWRLYLAGSVAAFRVGSMQLFQVLFAGPAVSSVPPTRADIYAAG